MNKSHLEIERKFLPDISGLDLNMYPSVRITQAYISTDPAIRVRQMGGEFILTVKTSGTLAVNEYEIPLTEGQFNALLKKTEPGRVEKTRYRIPLEGLTIELDIFGGNLDGLMIAEVEFPSEEAARGFVPPAWLGKEVTEDVRYKNSSLVRFGAPE